MLIAAGIDLGGTKSAIQIFDESWSCVDRRRDPTPKTYPALIALLAEQMRWARAQSHAGLPIGIAAAGLIDARGRGFAANLPTTDQPFPADLAHAAGGHTVLLNDGRATALSEAVFGAGRDQTRVLSLTLGTGVGGGVALNGKLIGGPAGLDGEFGHIPLAASVVAHHGLSVHRCGCGRMGCVETYLSGPGLTRLAKDLTGTEMTAEEIGAAKYHAGPAQDVWHVWLEIAAELLAGLCLMVNPDIVVLSGGLSSISGIEADLSTALAEAQIAGFAVPDIVIAEGGPSSGARGAAYAAWQDQRDG